MYVYITYDDALCNILRESITLSGNKNNLFYFTPMPKHFLN